MHKYILIAFLFFGQIGTAQADLTPETEKALRTSVTNTLDYYQRIFALEGQGDLEMGEMTLTQKDTFYQITIPHITFKNNNTTLKIGTITINATPDKNNTFLASMALPRTVTYYKGTATEPRFTLTIGQQKFAGLWDATLQTFTKVDSKYEDIALVGDKDLDVTATLKQIEMKMNLTPNEKHTAWSGPAVAIAKNFSLIGTGTQVKKLSIQIDSLRATADYDQIDLAKTQSIRLKVLDFITQNPDPREDDARNFAAETLKMGTTLLNGQKNTLQANGILVSVEEQPTKAEPNPEEQTFKLSRFYSNYDIQDVLKDEGTFKMNIGMDDLSLIPVDDFLKGLIPYENNIEVSFTKMPMKEITMLFDNVISTLARGDQTETVGGESPASRLLKKLPETLAKAGATMTVTDTYIRSKDLSAFLSGSFVASKSDTSPVPAVGSMTLVVEGIDEALEKYSTLLKDDKNADYRRFSPVIQIAPLVQVIGKKDQNATGKSRIKYHLEVKPNGQMLLNGQDLKAVQQMMPNVKP